MARKRRASDDPDLLLTPLAPRKRKGTPHILTETSHDEDGLADGRSVDPAGSADTGCHVEGVPVDARRGAADQPAAPAADVGAENLRDQRQPDTVSGDVAGGSSSPILLPAHSPIGGSSIERIIACPGSQALIELVRSSPDFDEEDPEYRKDGVLAHSLAEHCLDDNEDAAEAMLLSPGFDSVTPQMADAVQVYIDYVKQRCLSAGSERVWDVAQIEKQHHRPEIHPLYYGKLDAWIEGGEWDNTPKWGEVVDYKNGAGVVVSPVENPQLLHYAGLKVGLEPTPEYPDDMPIQLTIVQPNAYGLPPIRSWTTTAGFIRKWLKFVMLPAIARAQTERYLDVGEHCRWCPAKLACPAQKELVATYASVAPKLVELLPNPNLRRLYERITPVKAAIKAIEAEMQRRLMAGVSSDELGAKLVEGKVDRAWKENAPLEEWGDLRFEEPKLKSPAQIEKLGDKGKAFVREWAHKPPGRPTVAPLDDRREAIKQADITTVFAAYTGGEQ